MNLILPTFGFNRSLLRHRGFWLTLASALLVLGCSDAKTGSQGAAGGKPPTPPVPVTVAPCLRKDMPVEVEATGSVEPFASVGIKSQVEGVLERVHFSEGAQVRAGDLLFSLDARPFTARLNRARAALAKDRAALDNARKQAERYRPAAAQGYVSEEQSDQAQTSFATLAAAVQEDEATLASAQLDLDYCTIRSPLSGMAGDVLVDAGNLVKAAADAPLVTIHQIVPIKVSFTLPEQTLPTLKTYLAGGALEVLATPAGSAATALRGTFSFLDNAVDTSTGTIRLKATFANSEQSLWPGQFVNVRLLLTTQRDAAVIPSQAVQTGQSGAYVYVVTAQQTVEERPVAVAFSARGEAVIAAGLAVGETVVTDGQLRLRPGAAVKVLETGAGSARSEGKP